MTRLNGLNGSRQPKDSVLVNGAALAHVMKRMTCSGCVHCDTCEVAFSKIGTGGDAEQQVCLKTQLAYLLTGK